jgi:hypothetical protein
VGQRVQRRRLTFNASPAYASAGNFVTTSESFSVSAWLLLNDISGWHTAVGQDGDNVSGAS